VSINSQHYIVYGVWRAVKRPASTKVRAAINIAGPSDGKGIANKASACSAENAGMINAI
jgi:hypothetical protein